MSEDWLSVAIVIWIVLYAISIAIAAATEEEHRSKMRPGYFLPYFVCLFPLFFHYHGILDKVLSVSAFLFLTWIIIPGRRKRKNEKENNKMTRLFFYPLVMTYYWFVFFTHLGDYWHGGTLSERQIMYAAEVLIVAAAIKLLSWVRLTEKIVAALCAVIPGFSIASALISFWV